MEHSKEDIERKEFLKSLDYPILKPNDESTSMIDKTTRRQKRKQHRRNIRDTHKRPQNYFEVTKEYYFIYCPDCKQHLRCKREEILSQCPNKECNLIFDPYSEMHTECTNIDCKFGLSHPS